MQDAILLGQRVRDKVTGLEGVVIARVEHLTGCDTVAIHPGLDKDGKVMDPHWCDFTRCEVIDATSVMAVPTRKEERGGPHDHPRIR